MISPKTGEPIREKFITSIETDEFGNTITIYYIDDWNAATHTLWLSEHTTRVEFLDVFDNYIEANYDSLNSAYKLYPDGVSNLMQYNLLNIPVINCRYTGLYGDLSILNKNGHL